MIIEGSPSLFTTCGPDGPAALVYIIIISENDLNWTVNLITTWRKMV